MYAYNLIIYRSCNYRTINYNPLFESLACYTLLLPLKLTGYALLVSY
jgi:hypothetical protein